MANIRNSASACARLLNPPTNQVGSHWRTVSPDRWRLRVDSCNMSTVPHLHNHTDAKDPKDTTTKQDGKSKSYFESFKEQVKYVERVKDNIASGLSNVGALTTVVPSRLSGDWQRYIPFAMKMKEKVQSDIQHSIDKQKLQLEKLEQIVKDRMMLHHHAPKNKEPQEQDSFEKAMHDVNESVVNFYDTVDRGVTKRRLKTGSLSKAVSEDDLMKSILKSVWVAARSESKDATASVVKTKPLIQKDFVSKTAIECRTRALVEGIKTASTLPSQLHRTEDFCKHMLQYSNARSTATRENIVPYLLKFRGLADATLAAQANEALALIGYVDPVKGQGIRILSIDGGGTRGLLAIESMKMLQARCGTDIVDMFDYVCGVSTGSLVAAMIFLCRVSLDDCELMYKDFSRQMFTRNRVLGTSKLVWNHAFYDTEIWENILKTEIGEKRLIEYSRDRNIPKYSGMSTLMNVPKLRNFIFRNYNLPPHTYSSHAGGCSHRIWEIIRASTAAPGYFEEFQHGDYVHQDGGIMTNNPTAVAIQESRLLWPNESIQCVISLGTGRYEPAMELRSSKIALKDKVMKIVDSATDTEAVHDILHTLLPENSYYRFNPYLSEYFQLDEIRPDKIAQMVQETQLYLRKNNVKMDKAITQLSKPRHLHQRAIDKLSRVVDSVRT